MATDCNNVVTVTAAVMTWTICVRRDCEELIGNRTNKETQRLKELLFTNINCMPNYAVHILSQILTTLRDKALKSPFSERKSQFQVLTQVSHPRIHTRKFGFSIREGKSSRNTMERDQQEMVTGKDVSRSLT